jgi:hypothetical protein
MDVHHARARLPRAIAKLALSGWLCVGACSSSAADMQPTGDAGPYGLVASQSGALSLEVRTGPVQPPTRGLSVVTLIITDAQSGEAKDGLELSVVPWMPAMGHGTSVKPIVAAEGGGEYLVSNVNMYMGGAWDLRIAIANATDQDAAEADADRATLHFTIR